MLKTPCQKANLIVVFSANFSTAIVGLKNKVSDFAVIKFTVTILL